MTLMRSIEHIEEDRKYESSINKIESLIKNMEAGENGKNPQRR